jgi:hypothetical protein
VTLLLRRLARDVRSGALSALVVLLAVALGLEEPPCSSPCDESGDDNRCSPICHAGACAKLAHASVPMMVVLEQTPVLAFTQTSPLLGESTLTPSSGVADSVFHPPRA